MSCSVLFYKLTCLPCPAEGYVTGSVVYKKDNLHYKFLVKSVIYRQFTYQLSWITGTNPYNNFHFHSTYYPAMVCTNTYVLPSTNYVKEHRLKGVCDSRLCFPRTIDCF